MGLYRNKDKNKKSKLKYSDGYDLNKNPLAFNRVIHNTKESKDQPLN